MNAIEINHLFKVFRGKKLARVEALKNLSLTIPTGEVFGFLGPNGAGKSTTIKTLMGLIRPTSGQVRLMGLDVTDARSRLLVGFLPENPAFYDFLSASEYLQFVGRTFKMEPALLKKRIEEVLERFDLVAAAKRPMRGYSKGMVQRLGLAQTLVHDPDLYILDEPMSGLDPLGRALVKDLIKELKQKGKTVFFSSHITSDVESVCDRVGIILKGELQTVESVDTLHQQGIEGYLVTYVQAENTQPHSVRLGVDELSDFLVSAAQSQRRILLVEPQRKDLEAFFLDIVHGKS
jgi:ABC-2 type transport system ATP-binding protein